MKIRGILIALMIFSSLVLVSAASPSTAPQISVTLLNQDPDPVQQGDVVEVRFKVENLGGETTQDIILELLPSYPFTLYTGTEARNIGKLRAGQTGADAVIVDYKLKVDEKAVEGDNEIEMKIKSGGTVINSYTQDEFMIDVNEYTKPDLQVYIRDKTILLPNTKGTVTIEVANVDITDIKFLQFTLLPSEDYHLLSSSGYVYMGDVDSDDTESEEFEIFIGDVKDGVVDIPVKLVYQDSNENKFEEVRDLGFNVYSSGELSKYGLVQRSYTKYILILAVVAIIVWWIWKRRKKR